MRCKVGYCAGSAHKYRKHWTSEIVVVIGADGERGSDLKVVSGEKEGGLRVGSINRYYYGTVVLDTVKNLELAVVFYSADFRFHPLQRCNS